MHFHTFLQNRHACYQLEIICHYFRQVVDLMGPTPGPLLLISFEIVVPFAFFWSVFFLPYLF